MVLSEPASRLRLGKSLFRASRSRNMIGGQWLGAKASDQGAVEFDCLEHLRVLVVLVGAVRIAGGAARAEDDRFCSRGRENPGFGVGRFGFRNVVEIKLPASLARGGEQRGGFFQLHRRVAAL